MLTCPSCHAMYEVLDRRPATRQELQYQRGSLTRRPPIHPHAVDSLVAGVVLCWFTPIPAVVAIVRGISGIRRTHRGSGYRGRWMAITGLAAGVISLILWACVAWIIVLVAHGASLMHCQSNLRYLGDVLATDTRDGLPDSIEPLLANPTNAPFAACPATSDAASPSARSYVYVGRGYTFSSRRGSRSDDVILFEPMAIHDDKTMAVVLCGDLHVEALFRRQLLFQLQQMEDSRRWVGPATRPAPSSEARP